MTTQRRGFLKLGAVILGSLALTKYAEPLLAMDNTFNDWIEDKGDFFIVRVPDFKTFARETLDKPTIFLMGQQAIVQNVAVGGVVNIYAPNGGRLTDSCIDAMRMVVARNRPLIDFKGNIDINGCHLFGADVCAAFGLSDQYRPESGLK